MSDRERPWQFGDPWPSYFRSQAEVDAEREKASRARTDHIIMPDWQWREVQQERERAIANDPNSYRNTCGMVMGLMRFAEEFFSE